jgi:secreted PhoX family phosphatase
VILCEDSTGSNMLRALTRDGLIFDLALNNLSGGADEFSGATFGPGGQVLYTNMQSNGITYAIWGPWSKGLI